MQTHTVFTLVDGSRHDDINKAMNHCEEAMGAETRDMLYHIFETRSVYKAALALVADKKYDKAIFEYVRWRQEHDALVAYNKEEMA